MKKTQISGGYAEVIGRMSFSLLEQGYPPSDMIADLASLLVHVVGHATDGFPVLEQDRQFERLLNGMRHEMAEIQSELAVADH